jgi:hypothetical protein
MKTLAVWGLLFVGLVSLTACHWNRHHHHFADGHRASDHV